MRWKQLLRQWTLALHHRLTQPHRHLRWNLPSHLSLLTKLTQPNNTANLYPTMLRLLCALNVPNRLTLTATQCNT